MKERIKSITKYFVEFRVVDDAEYIKVRFPDKWVIDAELCVGSVGIQKDKDGYYFVFSDADDGFDVLFDTIDNIILFNKEIEEKTELLIQKANELKGMFEDYPLEKLKTLKFTFDDSPKKKRGTKKKKEDGIVKETDTEIIEEAKEEPPVNNNSSNEEVEEEHPLLTLAKKITEEA